MNVDKIIEHLGGPTAVARECDISPQAVSQWRRSGIPKPWEKYLRTAHPNAPWDPDTQQQLALDITEHRT